MTVAKIIIIFKPSPIQRHIFPGATPQISASAYKTPRPSPKGKLRYKAVKWKRWLPKNVLSDAEIVLTGYYPSKNYPERLRPVRYWDDEQGREFLFLTNAIGLKALLVAELHKNRWQIELLFKWLKQHLGIKKFWGTSENAVKTRIYVAIITYCLVSVVQYDMRIERLTYEVLQILSISLTDKTPLKAKDTKKNFSPAL